MNTSLIKTKEYFTFLITPHEAKNFDDNLAHGDSFVHSEISEIQTDYDRCIGNNVDSTQAYRGPRHD